MQPPAEDPAPPAGPRRIRWRRVALVVLAVVLLSTGGVAGTAFAVDLHAKHALSDARARYRAVVTGLAAAVVDSGAVASDARTVVAQVRAPEAQSGADLGSLYEVTDPSLVAALQMAVAANDAAVADARTAGTALPSDAALDVMRVATDHLAALDAALVAATARVKVATQQLSGSHAQWQLQQARTAFDAAAAHLAALVGPAQSTLDGSARKVADDSVRAALGSALDAARAAAGAGAASTLDALRTRTATLTDAGDDLAAAVQAVTQAQAEWQQGQDAAAAAAAAQATTAAAAAQAAAAAAAAATTGAPPATAPVVAVPPVVAPPVAPSSGTAPGTPTTTPTPTPTSAVQTVAQVIAGLQAARSSAGLRNSPYTAATCTKVTTVTGTTYQAILSTKSKTVLSTTVNPMGMTGVTTTVNGAPSVRVTLYRCTG